MSGNSATPLLAVGVQPGNLFDLNEDKHKLVFVYNWESHDLTNIYDGGKVLWVSIYLTHHVFDPDAGEGGLNVSIHTVFSPDGQ